MAGKKNIDEKIMRIVQSIESDIPASVEEKLLTTAETIRPLHKTRIKRLPLSLGILTSAAIIILAFLFLFPLFHQIPEPQITEIITEFELRDKNIKIIFIQSQDFKLFEEELE
jgi:hypothetical protein